MNMNGTGWSSPDTVKYYENNRRCIEDLYPSERYYFDDVIRESESVLDIGCAAGGMCGIAKGLNPSIRYCGVDISDSMIDSAKKRFHDGEFIRIRDSKLPFGDNVFAATVCFGVLHMVTDWKSLLAEAWRVTSGKIIFDLRLHNEVSGNMTGTQRLMFSGVWDGLSTAPYIIIGIDEFRSALNEICGGHGCNVHMYGYWHDISDMTEIKIKTACMTAIKLEKKSAGKSYFLNLPSAVKKQFYPDIDLDSSDYEKACRTISSLEKNFDIKKLLYLGVNYWAVLRNIIGYSSVYSTKQSFDSLLGRFSNSFFVKHFFSRKALKKALLNEYENLRGCISQSQRAAGDSDLLFFTCGFEYVKYNGGYYNRFFDPLKEKLEGTGLRFSDIHADFQKIRKEPGLHKSQNISEYIRKADALAFLINATTEDVDFSYYSEFCGLLKSRYPELGVLPSATEMKYYMSRLVAYSWMFRNFIALKKPSTGILTCYYNDLGMAFVDACKKSGVATVEIQHSHVNEWDWNWLHWDSDSSSHGLVPEHIAVWDKSFMELFERFRPIGSLKPFVIGNLWLQKSSKDFSGSRPEIDLALDKYKKILYSAPFCNIESVSDAFPDILLNAFADTPEEMIWIIRTHYKTDKCTLRKIEERLSASIKMNKVIFLKDEYSLYELFEYCDVHVSQTSTTVLEAEYFGIKNIIIGKRGRSWFSDKIENGTYFYSSTSQELLHQVKLVALYGKKAGYDSIIAAEEVENYLNTIKDEKNKNIAVDTVVFEKFLRDNSLFLDDSAKTRCMDWFLPFLLKTLSFARMLVNHKILLRMI